MQRVVEYRAWDTELSKYLAWREMVLRDIWNDPSYIIEQWTGLYDCRGIKIFEGDRLAFIGKDSPGGFVEWHSLGLKLRWDSDVAKIRGEKYYDGIPMNLSFWEVKGNIHEIKEASK